MSVALVRHLLIGSGDLDALYYGGAARRAASLDPLVKLRGD
jgi:hypothetical protein